MEFKKLQLDDIDAIVSLGVEFNHYVAAKKIEHRMLEMFHYDNYHCFGVTRGRELIGFAGCWVTTRIYVGKQLEIDDFIISGQYQAQGVGKEFLAYVEQWAQSQDCRSIELNVYVTNAGSHKFYFNQGYTIHGYHFQKPLRSAKNNA